RYSRSSPIPPPSTAASAIRPTIAHCVPVSSTASSVSPHLLRRTEKPPVHSGTEGQLRGTTLLLARCGRAPSFALTGVPRRPLACPQARSRAELPGEFGHRAGSHHRRLAAFGPTAPVLRFSAKYTGRARRLAT